MTGWLTAEIEYEGFPLMLRRPATLDRERMQSMCTERLTVTHTFTHFKPNGLPEPDYNDRLIEFDLAIQRAFNNETDGAIVLVETFGGRRNYYFYVANTVCATDRLRLVRENHPTEMLETHMKTDPAWGFIDRYARDYF